MNLIKFSGGLYDGARLELNSFDLPVVIRFHFVRAPRDLPEGGIELIDHPIELTYVATHAPESTDHAELTFFASPPAQPWSGGR
jgi:hypothetical protein